MNSGDVDGIILAAGLSRRMGTNKLLLPFQGKPLAAHTLDLARSFSFASLTLVIREETAAALNIPDWIRVVNNPAPEEGQSLSLRLGLREAGAKGYLFFTADQPLLDAATVHAVLEHADDDSIVVPVHAGTPGNPVFFAARFREDLLIARGDKGGRDVRDKHPAACRYVPVRHEATLWDIDTEEQYLRLLSQFPAARS